MRSCPYFRLLGHGKGIKQCYNLNLSPSGAHVPEMAHLGRNSAKMDHKTRRRADMIIRDNQKSIPER
jgi:hypothetical protein